MPEGFKIRFKTSKITPLHDPFMSFDPNESVIETTDVKVFWHINYLKFIKVKMLDVFNWCNCADQVRCNSQVCGTLKFNKSAFFALVEACRLTVAYCVISKDFQWKYFLT